MGALKEKRDLVILERQKALLPDALDLLPRYKIDQVIKQLSAKKRALQYEKEISIYYSACPTRYCRGYLSKDGLCLICERESAVDKSLVSRCSSCNEEQCSRLPDVSQSYCQFCKKFSGEQKHRFNNGYLWTFYKKVGHDVLNDHDSFLNIFHIHNDPVTVRELQSSQNIIVQRLRRNLSVFYSMLEYFSRTDIKNPNDLHVFYLLGETSLDDWILGATSILNKQVHLEKRRRLAGMGLRAVFLLYKEFKDTNDEAKLATDIDSLKEYVLLVSGITIH